MPIDHNGTVTMTRQHTGRWSDTDAGDFRRVAGALIESDIGADFVLGYVRTLRYRTSQEDEVIHYVTGPSWTGLRGARSYLRMYH